MRVPLVMVFTDDPVRLGGSCYIDAGAGYQCARNSACMPSSDLRST
jgi:hypothetical protein